MMSSQIQTFQKHALLKVVTVPSTSQWAVICFCAKYLTHKESRQLATGEKFSADIEKVLHGKVTLHTKVSI